MLHSSSLYHPSVFYSIFLICLFIVTFITFSHSFTIPVLACVRFLLALLMDYGEGVASGRKMIREGLGKEDGSTIGVREIDRGRMCLGACSTC